jgi:hypothetical protein
MALVGFTDSDPLADDSFGYRSHHFKSNANPFLTDVADVIYNGFTFPPVINAKGTIVPEYDKTGRSVKYLTVAITISGIITQFDRAAPAAGLTTATIDPHMDIIRHRLSQPCQPLTFKLQGFGTFNIQQGTTYDVDYGPKPMVLDWQPMGGGLAAEIEWLVVTRIPACAYADSFNGIVELGYDVAWGISDAALLTRTVTGYVELAKTRPPNAGGTVASNLINSAMSRWDRVLANFKTSFPPLPGYERYEEYVDSANRKSLKLTLKDVEIPSPSPYPAGVLKIDLTESLDANLPFYEWNWGISGSVTVPHTSRGVSSGSDTVNNKRLAWAAIGLILKERRDRAVGLSYYTAAKDDYAGKTERQDVTYIPQRIKFSNEMFGVGLSVDISYLLLCPSELVLKASGIFDYVRIPGMTWKAWRDFLNKNYALNPKFNVTPQQEMVVDLCHPLTSSSPGEIPVAPNQSTRTSIFSAEAPPEESSWIRYDNKFSYKNKNFTTVGTVLSPSAKPKKEKGSQNPRSESDLIITKPDSDSSSGNFNSSSTGNRFMLPDLQTAADEICYVTMRGSAVRIGYPINAPELISIGGAPVAKYGTDKIVPESKPSGFKKGSEKVSIYKLSWRKSYIITTTPENWKVETTGLSQTFM